MFAAFLARHPHHTSCLAVAAKTIQNLIDNRSTLSELERPDMKRLFLPLASTATVLAAPALADFTYDFGNDSAVTFYGQFNPAIISLDDGQETETNLLDNDLSNSRVGARFHAPWGANTFRFLFETGLGLPNSTEVNQLGSDYSRFTREDIRHFDFSLEGEWGKVSLGQGSMAADGAAERDLSLVGMALYSYTADSVAGFIFRDAAGNLTGPTIGATLNDFDGARRGRIRYDSRDYNGFSFAASAGQNILNQDDEGDYFDATVSYNGPIGKSGVELASTLSYQLRDDDAGDRTDIVFSGSALLPNGLSFTGAVGNRDDDASAASDPTYYYAKIAYEKQWFSWGKTGIGLHYWDGEDFNVDGSDSDVWGIGIVQKIDQANIDAYLTYQEYSYADTSGDFQDASAIVLGARWKF